MFRKIVNIILVAILIFFLFLGGKEYMTFYLKDTEDKQLASEVIQIPKGSKDKSLILKQEEYDPIDRKIDFIKLKTINPDIVGWIYIPGTKIDYPILCGKDNKYYLYHTYKKRYSALGSIFTYSGSDLEKDDHIALFGHNTVSGQAFGTIHKYKKKSFADSHDSMFIYTPRKTKKCKLISAFSCNEKDAIFSVEEERPDLVQSLIERSQHDFQVNERSGQLFTLSTCNGYNGTNQRYVTHFIVIDEKYVLN